jgi:hypothetical protein
MTQTFTGRFVHRLNDDGTIDSICTDCFVTVVTAAVSESVLEREERKHNCDTLPLDRYKNCLYSEIYT